MHTFQPFSNEQDSMAIAELKIENRIDRIELYGSVQLTKDKQGHQHAKALQAVINSIVSELEKVEDLPDQVSVTPVEQVNNPFD